MSGLASDSFAEATRVLTECQELLRRRLEEARATAPQYNVFRLLGLKRAEIGLHSPFLADLLNPHGTHGQGSLFLRHFLDTLSKVPCLG